MMKYDLTEPLQTHVVKRRTAMTKTNQQELFYRIDLQYEKNPSAFCARSSPGTHITHIPMDGQITLDLGKNVEVGHGAQVRVVVFFYEWVSERDGSDEGCSSGLGFLNGIAFLAPLGGFSC